MGGYKIGIVVYQDQLVEHSTTGRHARVCYLPSPLEICKLGHLCTREATKWAQEASKKAGFESRYLKAPNFPEPGELHGFDYSKTEPLKLRPFKPKYHLTMGTYKSARP
jgi:hypothetical protein